MSLLTFIGLLAFAGGAMGLYLLPVVVAAARRVPDVAVIAVIDILLGWTVAGWVAALVMALRPQTGPGPVVHLVQNMPPYPQSAAGPAAPPGSPPAAPLPLMPPAAARPPDGAPGASTISRSAGGTAPGAGVPGGGHDA